MSKFRIDFHDFLKSKGEITTFLQQRAARSQFVVVSQQRHTHRYLNEPVNEPRSLLFLKYCKCRK